MAYKLIWSPAARDDLHDIVIFIARDNPERAMSFGYDQSADRPAHSMHLSPAPRAHNYFAFVNLALCFAPSPTSPNGRGEPLAHSKNRRAR
jgi:hypothetical protein